MFYADLDNLENIIGPKLQGLERKKLLIQVANNWYQHFDINLDNFNELLNKIDKRYGKDGSNECY